MRRADKPLSSVYRTQLGGEVTMMRRQKLERHLRLRRDIPQEFRRFLRVHENQSLVRYSRAEDVPWQASFTLWPSSF